MLGSSWNGLHAFLVTDAKPAALAEHRAHIQHHWSLPASRVHSTRVNETATTIVRKRCRTIEGGRYRRPESGSFCSRPGCRRNLPLAVAAYYAQWTKAALCFQQVQRLEAQWRDTSGDFRFVLKMRPDWPFVSAPPLKSFESYTRAIVYSRFRCARTTPLLLPPIYYGGNTKHIMAINANCAPGRSTPTAPWSL